MNWLVVILTLLLTGCTVPQSESLPLPPQVVKQARRELSGVITYAPTPAPKTGRLVWYWEDAASAPPNATFNIYRMDSPGSMWWLVTNTAAMELSVPMHAPQEFFTVLPCY